VLIGVNEKVADDGMASIMISAILDRGMLVTDDILETVSTGS